MIYKLSSVVIPYLLTDDKTVNRKERINNIR